MYLDRVALSNIRGFEKLDFKLGRPDGTHAGWTVFTGDNGSGKSTLLKAIAIGLSGPETARALQPSFNRWVREAMRQDEVSPESKPLASEISLNVLPVKEEDFDNNSQIVTTPVLPRISFDAGDRELILRATTRRRGTRGFSSERTLWSPNARGWFSCGYGPFRRVFGNAYEARALMESPRTARYATLFREEASLVGADNWLRDLAFRKLENRSAERQQLDNLISLLNDDLLPNQMRVDRIDSDGIWLVDRNGIRLAWNEMSDGYRTMLALLVDLFRNLVEAYTIYDVHNYSAQIPDQDLSLRSGIVLIDEVDSHLHPEWQREIGFWLKRHFPKMQFLVTTHSPLICQAADPNGLFVLPEPGSDEQPRALSHGDYLKIIASRPDTILLTSAFGLQNTRSEVMVEARSEYSRLRAMQRGGKALSPPEQERLAYLSQFVLTDEEL